jgi:hypothetical protein
MPNLIQSFQGRDIGHLRIVARFWGIELASPDMEAASKELAEALLDPILSAEIIDSLPDEARTALATLVNSDGKSPWAAFARLFGDIREAGPGRRDRERMYLDPLSSSEALFYRAFLARAFFDLPSGAQDFAYIPEDLLQLINVEEHDENKGGVESSNHAAEEFTVRSSSEPLGRAATQKEREHQSPPSNRLIDDATTLLAALRMGLPPPETIIPVGVVKAFLYAAKIILPSPNEKEGEVPQIEPVRLFLEASRQEAQQKLATAWLDSENFNELHQVPGLVCEGEWNNQPKATRAFLLALLNGIPRNQWWSLAALIHDIKEKNPDFQRPVGDYDSWFIKRESDGTFLRGFSSWGEVDGALIRYLITGPLYWLGKVELATPSNSDMVTAFRMTSKRESQSSKRQFSTFGEQGNLSVTSSGKISVPRSTPRSARYQIARFCEWGTEKPDEYYYTVTTTSLEKARRQGLKVSQLLSLLARNAAAEIPPAFIKALKRWENNGTEARLEIQTILQVNRPEILDDLRNSRAGRFLGETLGPVTVVVKSGAQAKILAALAESGLLAENQAVIPGIPGQANRNAGK